MASSLLTKETAKASDKSMGDPDSVEGNSSATFFVHPPTKESKERVTMGNSPHLDLFLDCLWGVTLLVAVHLFPFNLLTTEGLGAIVNNPALWFHGALLLTFGYTYTLRLRCRLERYLNPGGSA